MMKGELLFQARHSKDYHDGVHVFSFANGLGVDWHRLQKQAVKRLADQGNSDDKLEVRTYMNHYLLQDLQFCVGCSSSRWEKGTSRRATWSSSQP